MKNLLPLLLLLPVSTHAEWTATRVTGEAWIQQGVNREILHDGSTVADDDLIATGAGARVELRSGSSRLGLGGNTRFQLKALSTSKTNPLTLFYGKVRAYVKPEAGQTFHIQTPSAVAGVRGTEYFLQSENGRDFACTIDGLVEVEAKRTGQIFLVPPRSGVEIAGAKAMSVAPTPDELVDRWRNETSADEFRPVVMDAYPQLDVRFHELHPNFSLGLRANATFAHLQDVGYNSLPSRAQNDVLQIRLSPALRFANERRSLTWIPWILVHQSSQDVVLDVDPRVNEKSFARFDLGELFADTRLGQTNLRGGYQTIKWTDGSLFSFNFWNLDPYVFPGLRAQHALGNHYFDLVAFMDGERGKVNGAVPAEMLGLKYDFSTWFSVFVLQRDYQAAGLTTPALLQGHKIRDYGFYSSQRIGAFDAKVSYIGESGELFEASAISPETAHGQMVELGMGAYPLREKNLRVGVAMIDANSEFLPGFESPYNLGYAQVFVRNNLRQYRAKLSFAPRDGDWSTFLEWIQSRARGTSRFTAWRGQDEQLMDELDLSLTKDIGSQVKALFTAFYLEPSAAMSASSPTWSRKTGWGAVVNLQYSF